MFAQRTSESPALRQAFLARSNERAFFILNAPTLRGALMVHMPLQAPLTYIRTPAGHFHGSCTHQNPTHCYVQLCHRKKECRLVWAAFFDPVFA